MVHVGYRPILWHIMKYYAFHGHNEFILCLGYKSDMIKTYFLNYDECLSNDFTISMGGKKVEMAGTDIEDWRITFVDTGLHSNIGQRLKAVQKHVEGEEMFLANYTDGLTDLNLTTYINYFTKRNKTAGFVSVKPIQSFHVVEIHDDGRVMDLQDLNKSKIWMNGGFFVLRNDIFKYMKDREELVHEPFQRLIKKSELITYKHNGFWISMDTFKDKQRLDDMYARGDAPWEVWRASSKS